MGSGKDPGLNETEVLFRIEVVFTVHYPGSRGHKLDAAPTQGFFTSNGVLVSQSSVKNVGDDFHILVSMSTETPRGLDQIIIDNPQTTEPVSSSMPFSKRKMESAFQPIFIGPTWVIRFIGTVSKPRRVRFRDKEVIN